MMNKELADKLCLLVRQELGSDKFSIITQAVYRKTGSAEPTIVKAVIACMLTAMYAEFLMADISWCNRNVVRRYLRYSIK